MSGDELQIHITITPNGRIAYLREDCVSYFKSFGNRTILAMCDVKDRMEIGILDLNEPPEKMETQTSNFLGKLEIVSPPNTRGSPQVPKQAHKIYYKHILYV